ncbi:TPA: hypothetical protein NKT41_004554 [Vibrio parahaemolyticus]|nr:hypothetical protein [Vibrio parahaemolyticus]
MNYKSRTKRRSSFYHWLVTFSLIALALFSPSIFANTIDCGTAFDSKGDIVLGDMSVCENDPSLIGVGILLGDLPQTNGAVKGVYKLTDTPIPEIPTSIKNQTSLISTMLHFTSHSSGYIWFFAGLIVIPFFLYRGMSRGKIFRSRDDINAALKTGGGFALSGPWLGGISPIQIIYIFAILCGLGLGVSVASYLPDRMLGSQKAETIAKADEYMQFNGMGQAYAQNLVRGLYGAEQSALTLNYMNIRTENASMVKSGNGSGGGFLDSIIGFFSDYEDRDPTVSDVASSLAGDTTIVARIKNPVLNSNAGATLEPFDYREDGSAPLFERNLSVSDLYKARNTMSISSPIPEISDEALKAIANSKAIPQIQETLLVRAWSTEVQAKVASETASQQMQELIYEVQDQHPDASALSILSALDGYLFGAFSLDATKNDALSIELKFSPFFRSGELAERGNEPIYKLFDQTKLATTALRRFNCYKNIEQMAQWEAWLTYELSKGSRDVNDKFRNISDAAYVYPVCLLPTTDGTFTSLLDADDQKVINQLVSKIKSGEVNTSLEILINQFKPKTEGKAQKYLADAKREIEVLSNYFARVSAAKKHALLKNLEIEIDESSRRAITDARQRGILGLPTMFLSANDTAIKVGATLDGAKPSASAASHVAANGILPMRNIVDDYSTELDNARFSGSVINNSVSGDIESQATSLDEDQDTDIAGNVDSALRAMIDMAIPADDALKQTMGFDKSLSLTDNYQACATTTTCMKFEGNPIVGLIMYGHDIFKVALNMQVLNQAVQVLDAKIQGITSSDSSDSGSWLSNVFSSVLSGLKEVIGTLSGLKYIQAFSGVIATLFGIVATILLPMLFLGIYLGFMIQMYVIMQIAKSVITYLLEGILAMVLSSISFSLVFVDLFGVRMVSVQDHVFQIIRILLTPPLIVISFIIYYQLCTVGIFMINSIAGILNFIEFDGNLSNLIPAFISYLLMLGITVALYCYVEKYCREQGFELGNSALNMIGIQSIFKSMGGNLSSAIGAYMIANQVTQTLNIVSARAKQEAAASKLSTGNNDSGKSSDSVVPKTERKMSDTPSSDEQTNNLPEADGGMSRSWQAEDSQKAEKPSSQEDQSAINEDQAPGFQRPTESKND